MVAEVVAAKGWRELRPNDPETLVLSARLRNLSIHSKSLRPANFRGPDSVSRKSADVMTAHSSYAGRQTKGGRLTAEVVKEFERRQNLATTKSDAFPTTVGVGDPEFSKIPTAKLEIDPAKIVQEGTTLEQVIFTRERDPSIRKSKIRSVTVAGGLIACEVCDFDFGTSYGRRGQGYIEVHHRIPLHVTGPTRTTLEDLALLCSNCHRMIHHTSPWLTVDELKKIVLENMGFRAPRSEE